MAKRSKRLRGEALAVELDKTAQFSGVLRARTKQTYLSEDYKLKHNISVNIYDAARSYRDKEGTPNRKIREILKDEEFRNAWRTFRGGGLRRGKETSTPAKFRAAEVIGWHSSRSEVIEKLRNVSP